MSKKTDPVGPRMFDPVPSKESGERWRARASLPAPHGTDTSVFRATPARSDQISGWLEDGQAVLDPIGRVTEINEALSGWFGRPTSATTGHRFWELLVERCADWRESLDAFYQRAGTFCELRLRLPAGDSGTAQWFRLERVRQTTGDVVRLHSILPPLADLEEASWDEYLRSESARREMFIRLLRAESQLKTLSDRWPGVIFSQRADFTFRFASSRIEELTGVSVSDWQTKPHLFWQIVHEADAEDLRQQLKQAKQTGQPLSCTYRVRHAQNGRVAYVMEHRQPNVSRGGLLLGYEGVWLDVTRQTIAEKRLCTAAWKETLSVLTMGLAHDFSNVMAGIHALSESFLDEVAPDHQFIEGLHLIKKNTTEASQLVHRIINLHQGRPGECQYHNLNEITMDLADLVRKIIPRRVQLTVELAPEALPVYLDAVELRQIAINLVLNAIDAMTGPAASHEARSGSPDDERGGRPSGAEAAAGGKANRSVREIPGAPASPARRLTLRTSAHAELPLLTNVHGAVPRTPAACFSVQDNGCGIKPRHLTMVFDPFFTTKNKGSGLGLYNARLFVEKHRGGITVDSQEGVGTSFDLWLPQADFTEADLSQTRTEKGEARTPETSSLAPLTSHLSKAP